MKQPHPHTQVCPGVPQAFLQLPDRLAEETEISVHKKVLFNQILADPAHYAAITNMLAQGRVRIGEEKLRGNLLIVWLQK